MINWNNSSKIIIDHNKVGGDLTDYPLYIDLSNLTDNFWLNVKSGGGDIRITTSDGITECPREIVSCDTTTKTGEVHALIPSVSSSVDTIVYIYYGNPDAEDYLATDTYGSQAVWVSYVGVWHLGESGSTKVDSKGNSNGTVTGTVTSVAGQMGNAAHFDADINSRIFVPDTAGLTNFNTPDSYSISFWARRWDPTNISDKSISEHWEQGDGIDPYPWAFRGFALNTSIAIGLYNGGTGAPSGITLNPGCTASGLAENTWGLFTFVKDRPNLKLRAYLNAVAKTTGTDTIPLTDSTKASANGFCIGERQTTGISRTPNLDIQEFRIYTGVKSTNEITTEYNNQSEPASFYTIVNQQSMVGVSSITGINTITF